MALDPTLIPTYNAASRATKGSGKAMFQRRNSDASAHPDTTWYRFPSIKESEPKDETSEDAYEDEGGFEYSQDGKRSQEFSGTFTQTEIQTKKLFVSTLRGEYILLLKEDSVQLQNGKYEYILFFGRVVPNFNLKRPNGDVPWKLKGVAMSSSLTLDISTVTGAASHFEASQWTGSVIIPKGDAYVYFAIS